MQAEAVLKLQLGQLTRLNKGKLTKEKSTLMEEISTLTNLMNSDAAVYSAMSSDLKEMKAKFAVERRTRISEEATSIDDLSLIKNSRSVVVLTKTGYLKRMPLSDFGAQDRGTRGKAGADAENSVETAFSCNDHDTLLFVTDGGVAHAIRAFQVPAAGRTARGASLPSVLPVDAGSSITAVLPIEEFRSDEYVVLTTERVSVPASVAKAGRTVTQLPALFLTFRFACRRVG